MSDPTGDSTAQAIADPVVTVQVVTDQVGKAPVVTVKVGDASVVTVPFSNDQILDIIEKVIASGLIKIVDQNKNTIPIVDSEFSIIRKNGTSTSTLNINVTVPTVTVAAAPAPAPVAAASAPVASDQDASKLWSNDQPQQQQEPKKQLPKQPAPRRVGPPRASSSASSDGSPAGASAGSPAVDPSLGPIRKPRRDDLPRIDFRVDDGIYYGDTKIDTQSLPTLPAIPEYAAKPLYTSKPFGIAMHLDNGKFLFHHIQSGVIKVYTPPTQSRQKNEPQQSTFNF